jgi:hypothetical protein
VVREAREAANVLTKMARSLSLAGWCTAQLRVSSTAATKGIGWYTSGTKGDVDRSRRAVSSQWRGTRDGAGPDLGGEEREQRNEEVRDRIGPGHQGSGTASDQYFYCVE